MVDHDDAGGAERGYLAEQAHDSGLAVDRRELFGQEHRPIPHPGAEAARGDDHAGAIAPGHSREPGS